MLYERGFAVLAYAHMAQGPHTRYRIGCCLCIFGLATEYPDLTGRFRVSECRVATGHYFKLGNLTRCNGGPPAPRVYPDTYLLPPSPLAHLSIAGEVRLSPCGGAAPPGRCCDPETIDGRWPVQDLGLASLKRAALGRGRGG